MSQFNLTLSPAQSEITLNKNSSFTLGYEITNNSSETVLLSSSISSWLPSNNEGNVTYNTITDDSIEFSLSNSDLKLNQDFTLGPNQKKQLVLKIKNNDPDEQDHYYTFFIQQKNINSVLNNSQNLAKIGSHLLISSNFQKQNYSSLIPKNISLYPRIKDIFFPQKISGEIFNQTSHYTQIDGQISLLYNHQNIWQSTLYPYVVLSQNSRLIKCLDTSTNQAISCQTKSPLWPGKYQIKISLNQNNSSSDYYQSFFILPYSFIVFILCSFLILFLILKNKHTISSKD